MTSNWPQVSDLKKPELYVIQLGELSTSWKFEGNQSKTVSWTGAKRKLKFDHDLVPVFLTWWPDPRSPGPEIFRSYVKRLPHRLCQIWRRCAPPFLRYLRKTLGGGRIDPPLPGRGLKGRGCITPGPARVNPRQSTVNPRWPGGGGRVASYLNVELPSAEPAGWRHTTASAGAAADWPRLAWS